MNIQLITFKTNQTIVGEVDDTKDEKIVIKKPVQIYSQMGKAGESMMGFSPFLEFAEQFTTGLEFSKDDILCTSTPIKEVINQYNKMFGSGIQMATAEELTAIHKSI